MNKTNSDNAKKDELLTAACDYAQDAEYYQKLEDESIAREKAVLNQVKQLVTKSYWAEIEDDIKECGFTSSFEIVDCPKGERQDSERKRYNHVFINQTTNGGYAGDDYAGIFAIPLPDKRYLQFYYSM